MSRVKIVQRPLGEAPEWVRDAWIGLSLPLVVERKRIWRGFGVITGPVRVVPQIAAILTGRTFKVEGFVINAKIAVEALSVTEPNAAQWWRDNVPELLRRNRNFVFDANACEQIEQVSD